MRNKITYTFRAENPLHVKKIRFDDGKSNAPKTGIMSVKSLQQEYADRWGVPLKRVKVTRELE